MFAGLFVVFLFWRGAWGGGSFGAWGFNLLCKCHSLIFRDYLSLYALFPGLEKYTHFFIKSYMSQNEYKMKT